MEKEEIVRLAESLAWRWFNESEYKNIRDYEKSFSDHTGTTDVKFYTNGKMVTCIRFKLDGQQMKIQFTKSKIKLLIYPKGV